MKKILFLLSVVTISFLTGCSSSPTSPANNNNPTATDSTAYFPIATGNSWTYMGSAGTYTVSLGADTTFNGHTWKIISNSAAAGHGFMRKEGSVYYQLSPPGFVLAGEVTALNETPGSTWTWNINSQTGTNQYVYTNASQGLTRTVLGKNYSNVIDVRMDYTFSFAGHVIGTGTYHYYYAKGIGLIDSDLGAQGDQPLSSYTLK